MRQFPWKSLQDTRMEGNATVDRESLQCGGKEEGKPVSIRLGVGVEFQLSQAWRQHDVRLLILILSWREFSEVTEVQGGDALWNQSEVAVVELAKI